MLWPPGLRKGRSFSVPPLVVRSSWSATCTLRDRRCMHGRARSGGNVVSLDELRAFARGPEDGEAQWLLGGLYTYRAVGADNGNAYTLVEVRGHSGLATPHHVHDREEEGFYVVEGEVTLTLGEETIQARAGSFAF